MKNLIRAELMKLRTTRMIYGLAVAALAFAAISTIDAVSRAGKSGGGAALSTGQGIRDVMSAGSSSGLVLLLIGILVMAGEFRHSTATSTFLVCPKRGRVVAAKLAASVLVAAAIAVAASGLTLALSMPWLASKHLHVDIFSRNVGLVLLGGIAVMMIWAAVGVGVGSLIRNQTAAVIVALAWVGVIESLLVSYVPEVGKWVPGGAADALGDAANRAATGGLLPVWAGGLVFVAYGVVFAAAGTRFTMRRDIS